MKNYWFSGGFVACLLVSAISFGCAPTEAQPLPKLLPPSGTLEDTAVAERGDIWVVSRLDAVIRAREEELYFGDVDMRIAEILVKPGQQVSAGETLIRLDTKDHEEEIKDLERELSRLVERGRFELELADADIGILELELQKLEEDLRAQRERDPRDGLHTSRDIELKALEIERARALRIQLEQRQIQEEQRSSEILERERSKLDEAALTAPFDGVAVHVDAVHGDPVKPFETAVLLADHTRLYAEMISGERFVPEQIESITGLCGDRSYSLTYEPLPQEDILEYLAEGETPPFRFAIESGVPAPEPGEYLSVLVTRALVEDALRLPVNAVYRSGESYVYLRTEEGKTPAPVKTGRNNDSYVEILSGLEEGDVVIVQ